MKKLQILTTFSRNPARFERQIHCLKSWAAIGAELIVARDSDNSELAPMFDACDEIFGENYTSFGIEEPTIGEMLNFHNDGCVLILNADIELDLDAQILPELEREIGDGMLILPRTHDLAGKQDYAPWGIEGIFVDPTKSPALVAMAERYRLGQPWWDVVLPLAHQRAGKKIYRPTEPIAFHKEHDHFWDLALCDAVAAQASIDLRTPVRANSRAINHFSTEAWNELFDWVQDIAIGEQTFVVTADPEPPPVLEAPCPTE